MAMLSSVLMSNNSEDAATWANLRDAIANSSGFQGWQQQQEEEIRLTCSLDVMVRLYLRETLETLAY